MYRLPHIKLDLNIKNIDVFCEAGVYSAEETKRICQAGQKHITGVTWDQGILHQLVATIQRSKLQIRWIWAVNVDDSSLARQLTGLSCCDKLVITYQMTNFTFMSLSVHRHMQVHSLSTCVSEQLLQAHSDFVLQLN